MSSFESFMALVWGTILVVVLLIDIAAYRRSKRSTITATVRDYLQGEWSLHNTLLAAFLGGGFVYLTGWYESPPGQLGGSIVWWTGSVAMFTLMFAFAIDLALHRRGLSPTKDSPMVRQTMFGFVCGGLIVHFTG